MEAVQETVRLRDYQEEAVEAVYTFLRERTGNPCIVIPTGGGKTPVIARICSDAVQKWGGRVLVLAHVKELLEQARDKLAAFSPGVKVGIYSAGLKSREGSTPVVIAGIQSIFRRALDLEPFDLILVDECHLLPPDGEGMYRTFLTEALAVNPNLRLIGLTATAFRTSSGALCGPDNLLNEIAFEVGVRELIVRGFLCPLVSKSGLDVDTSNLHIKRGEFVESEAEALMLSVISPACREVASLTEGRKSILVFCQSVRHATEVVGILRSLHIGRVELITGETLGLERSDFISDFRAGRIRVLVNVNVLTTGFDAPNVDAVAILRPTASPGLLYQMCGRGFRLSPGKSNCLILDFGGNLLRHGPIDEISIPKERKRRKGTGEPSAKVCPECKSVISSAYRSCPDCGTEFLDRPIATHEATAAATGVLSSEIILTEKPVSAVSYSLHVKRGAESRTLRVQYQTGWNEFHSEWVCFEHEGFARRKAESWWRERSKTPIPDSIEEAVALANAGALAIPEMVVVQEKPGEKFLRIVKVAIGPIPEGMSLDNWDGDGFADDSFIPEKEPELDIPF